MAESREQGNWFADRGKKLLGTPRSVANLVTSIGRNAVGLVVKDTTNSLRRVLLGHNVEVKGLWTRAGDIVSKGSDALFGWLRIDESVAQRKERQKAYFKESWKKGREGTKSTAAVGANLVPGIANYAKVGASLVRNTLGVIKDSAFGVANILGIKQLQVKKGLMHRLRNVVKRGEYALTETLSTESPKSTYKNMFSTKLPENKVSLPSTPEKTKSEPETPEVPVNK